MGINIIAVISQHDLIEEIIKMLGSISLKNKRHGKIRAVVQYTGMLRQVK